MPSDKNTIQILSAVLKILLIAVLSDIAAVFLLPVIFPGMTNKVIGALIDALLMTLFGSPFIWWFVVRPVHISAASVARRLETTTVSRDELTKEVRERRKAEENAKRNELLYRAVAQDLSRTLEELGRSNRELEQFATVASHDLQAPLRTVTSYLEYLAKDYGEKLDDRAKDYITRAVNASRRMSELIRELLLYSRVGTQKQPFSLVDMGSVLRKAKENLKKDMEDSDARIASGELPRVMGDEMQLVSLFQNLISNAIKYRTNEEQPVIRISAKKTGNEWVFGVHDNGIGIKAEYYERIFVIFQRLHTAEEYPGTGMGLALCKKIAEQHGGRIWAEPGADRGTSFYFSLPDYAE